MSAKVHDWQERLADYITAVRQDIDELGEVPCARFAAGAVEAQTGIDHYKPFAGKYKSEIGAAKALRKIGAGSLEATFDRHLERRLSPSFAQRGDIVFNGEAVGVCMGAVALFIAGGEIITLLMSDWQCAWDSGSAHA